MPDHVHMVLEKKFDSTNQRTPALGEIMHSIKGASSHAINRLLHRRGPLWQEEWFDRLPRSADSFHAKIAYVLDNPVRAGIATARYEYPHQWVSNPELLTQAPPRSRNPDVASRARRCFRSPGRPRPWDGERLARLAFILLR